MSELPNTWARVNLGQIADFEMGQAPPGTSCNKDGHGTVFVKAGEFGIERPIIREWTTDPLKFARWEDVLICVVGATSGKLNLGIDCAIGRSVAAIRPSEALGQRLLYRQLQLQVEQLRADSTGTAQGVISKQMLADIQVVLPPAPEQTRIADKLDTLLARINACHHRLDTVPALLKRFRLAVLTAAVSGDLTSDWRALNEVKPWTETTIGEMTLSSYYGPRFGKDEYTQSASGIPTIRTTDMDRVGRINVSTETPRVVVPNDKIEQFRVKPGDLLVTRTGSIGVMAVFDGNYLAIPSAYLIRFRFNSSLRTRFAYYRLASPKGQAELGLSATAVTQPNVNAEAIKRIQIELPTVEEQDEIIRRVETLYRAVESIEARYTAASAQVQRLTPLVLAKAFRGELTPQDPNDEPASALLASIAVQRDSATHAPKIRKPRTPSAARAPKESAAMTKSRQDEDVKGKPYLAGHLRRLGEPASAQALFKASELPVADFYKQLAWEVAQGHVKDNTTTLEPGHAAG